MTKTLVYLLILIVLSSCTTTIAKVAFGLRDPKPETSESLLKFLKKYHADTLTILTSDTNSYKTISTFPIPDIYIFDQRGAYIPYKDSAIECNGSAAVFISSLDKTKIYRTTKEMNLYWLLGVTQKNNESKKNNISENYDFVVVMTWAKYTGNYLYRNHNDIWIKNIYKNKKARILPILLNCDFQKNWGENYFNKNKFKF